MSAIRPFMMGYIFRHHENRAMKAGEARVAIEVHQFSSASREVILTKMDPYVPYSCNNGSI